VWRSRFKPGSYKDINLQSAPYQLSRFNWPSSWMQLRDNFIVLPIQMCGLQYASDSEPKHRVLRRLTNTRVLNCHTHGASPKQLTRSCCFNNRHTDSLAVDCVARAVLGSNPGNEAYYYDRGFSDFFQYDPVKFWDNKHISSLARIASFVTNSSSEETQSLYQQSVICRIQLKAGLSPWL
jgi:hypothetical protein